ncbi:4,5-DOPA dioxygenase extradiol [Corynebacterium yudongzhengii]|uniref:4,5-DOPA dioxygenase extradiol n=1 Tax=Corynebacterium yudongzhengii TaxID=2080740 RepID=A0A2U1T8M2_9CORY|nr:4,5-DOPA dioxygenase extradiol [Corynebacterium yudongzhengii]AWB82976.1 4,5-DOPA dioxygenase extradiol [Corynebacterium yudongzhengii]PWC02367.1 4,5-DOPA dioxygenase extradiol [Corynebacterium yudongzhengii]
MTTNALFVGHGSPMNAIETNDFTTTWADLGSTMRPRAILSVSAHWYTRGSGVTAMESPKTIHDFWGFPPELSELQYNAPGDPEIAQLVRDIAKPTLVEEDHQWGLDHGTWSVLTHMFPEADIPVIQLSIDGTKPLEYHVELGTRLARLAQEHNVLIVGSGNVVHNLSMIDWKAGDKGFGWADAFDDAGREIMLNDPARLPSLADHSDFRRAVPTPDHFLPLAYIAGVSAALDDPSIETFNDRRTMGSLSMTGYTVAA